MFVIKCSSSLTQCCCLWLQHADAARVPAQGLRHPPGQVSDADRALPRLHPLRRDPTGERRLAESLPQAWLQEALPDSARHSAADPRRLSAVPQSLTSRLHLPAPHTYLYIYSSKRRLVVVVCATGTGLWYRPSGDSAAVPTTSRPLRVRSRVPPSSGSGCSFKMKVIADIQIPPL